MSNYGWSTGASGYDDEDRLVSWTRDDNNLSQSWTLTNEGDWSQFVENTTTENRTHGPAHELTAVGSTVLSYDPKGNLTVDNTKSHGYTWDFDNRMSSADTDGDNTDDVTLRYDALGRRIAKTAGTNAVVYVSITQPIQYSPFAGQVVAEYASGAAPSSPTERYVYASYIDEPVLKDGTGTAGYYHRNSQYSVSALTSASGAVVERYGYEPYGELTILAADGSTVRASSSYANSYTYTGRRWDAELKLYYFRARYYDPGLGRFVGRDPYQAGGVTRRRAAYGAGSEMWRDPSGNCQCCCCPESLAYTDITVISLPDPLLPPNSRLGFRFRVVAKLRATEQRVELPLCRIKWYECSSSGGSLGQRPNEWFTPETVVPGLPPENAYSNWSTPYGGECPGVYQRYWEDFPSIFNAKGSTVNIKFAIRVRSAPDCDCPTTELKLYFRLSVVVTSPNIFDPTRVVFDPSPPSLRAGINQGEPKSCTEANVPSW